MASLVYKVTRHDGDHHEEFETSSLKEFNEKRIEFEERGKPVEKKEPVKKKK